MEQIARVYAEALFAVARDKGKLDQVRDQLAAFAQALEESRELSVFFFSPYFSSAEKREGIGRVLDGADPEFVNFLELLVEKHRMPVIFRIRRVFDGLWREEKKLLEVTLTSAIELDPKISERIGDEIAKQTDREVELSSNVDEAILGGLVLRVGNMVLDASLRNKLERLRKEVAQAA